MKIERESVGAILEERTGSKEKERMDRSGDEGAT
jgi:hypothetical protein